MGHTKVVLPPDKMSAAAAAVMVSVKRKCLAAFPMTVELLSTYTGGTLRRRILANGSVGINPTSLSVMQLAQTG